MYVNSLAYVRVKKRDDSEYFKIDSGVRQRFVMSLSFLRFMWTH